jgi:ABC-2 type transport system ATP-binding protein
MDPSASGLVVDRLVRRFDAFVLGPLSFQLAPGRALGLLGANGAGKTTLLTALAGQARTQGGTVRWRDRAIVRDGWRHRQWVSYVRDVPPLYAELTVGQTLAFVAALHATWRAARAQELLEVFRLAPRKRVGVLSRGMKTKLGLLLAVSHDVELLLLDEVTVGVDPDTRDEIQRFLRTLVTDRGVSVILSSHIFDDIERVSDEVLILRHGQPAFHGAMADASRDGLRELYFSYGRP